MGKKVETALNSTAANKRNHKVGIILAIREVFGKWLARLFRKIHFQDYKCPNISLAPNERMLSSLARFCDKIVFQMWDTHLLKDSTVLIRQIKKVFCYAFSQIITKN